jgi:predicted phage terminase large subunit-like protein
MFIGSDSFVTVYGGAAGSGKSYMGLMKFLLYVDDPNFFGYVFRLNATDMKGGGGLFQTACRMFQAYDKRVKYTKQPMCIYFPSGATINFTGLDGDAGLESIRGIEISAAMVDEGSQHDEDNIFWIISRLRTKAKMIPNIWITCNPDPDSFLRKWLDDFYLHPKGSFVDGELVEGRPNLDKDGILRWYLRVGDSVKWGATKKELEDLYGSSFPIDKITGTSTCQPRSFRFISATCHDNPPLLEADPNYVSNLLNLPRVEKERLYYGSWYARQESSSHFKRAWTPIVNPVEFLRNDPIVKRVRVWDLASSLPSEAYPDPDYTAGVLIARTKSGNYLVEDLVHGRWRAGELDNMLIEQTRADCKMYGSNYSGYLPIEPASAGKILKRHYAVAFALEGVPIRFFKVGSKKSKLDKFLPFSSVAENSLVYVVEAEWNEVYFYELEAFTGVRNRVHDDIVDSQSDGFNILAVAKELPVINPRLLKMS